MDSAFSEVAFRFSPPSLRLQQEWGWGGGRTDFLKVLKVPGPAPAEDEALRVREDAAVGDDVGGDGVGLQCLQEEEGEVREERRLQRHRGELAGDLNRLGSGAKPISHKYSKISIFLYIRNVHNPWIIEQ